MNINKNLTSIERSFNIACSIPVISLPASIARGCFGLAQTVTGFAIATLASVGQLFAKAQQKPTWQKRVSQGFKQLEHGILNWLRAQIEQIGAITVVGSLGFLAFHLNRKEGFDPVYKYNIPPSEAVAVN